MKRLAFFLMACLVVSCSTTTHIENSWVKKGVTNNGYGSAIVLALVGKNNDKLQQDVEEDMVAELKKKGYNAVSYFDEYGPRALDQSDEKAAVARLSKDSEDVILTAVLLDTAKEVDYTASTDNYGPANYYYRFWDYYQNRYVVYSPGYYTQDTHYFWECNLYAAHTQNLIYSARTESFDPSATHDLAAQLGHTVLRDMIEKEVIHPR